MMDDVHACLDSLHQAEGASASALVIGSEHPIRRRRCMDIRKINVFMVREIFT